MTLLKNIHDRHPNLNIVHIVRYLAIDNVEVGTGNRIPLWLFGCLY